MKPEVKGWKKKLETHAGAMAGFPFEKVQNPAGKVVRTGKKSASIGRIGERAGRKSISPAIKQPVLPAIQIKLAENHRSLAAK